MKTTTYAVNIVGVTQLLMNSNTALLTGEEKGRDPAKYEREHFMDKVYKNPDGKLIIPARALKRAFVEACKFLPLKPKGVSFKSYGPFIQSATLFPGDAILDVPANRVTQYTMVVNLDPSKGPKGPRGPRTRPMIPLPWKAETSIEVIDPILTLDVLQQIAERAGKQVGLLDGRSIDYGRCIITIEG